MNVIINIKTILLIFINVVALLITLTIYSILWTVHSNHHGRLFCMKTYQRRSTAIEE